MTNQVGEMNSVATSIADKVRRDASTMRKLICMLGVDEASFKPLLIWRDGENYFVKTGADLHARTRNLTDDRCYFGPTIDDAASSAIDSGEESRGL